VVTAARQLAPNNQAAVPWYR